MAEELVIERNIILDDNGEPIGLGCGYYLGRDIVADGGFGCIREILPNNKIAVIPRLYERMAHTLERADRELEIIVDFDGRNYVPF